MKKILLLFTILFIQTGFSQEEKEIFIEEGHWGLGGQLSLTSNTNESEYYNSSNSTETLNITIAPNFGYTIADNWFLGLSFMYNYSMEETISSDRESSSHGLGLAPNIRRYFPIFDQFAFNLQGSLEYLRRKSETTSSSITDSSVERTYCVAIRPGFSYILGNNFALEAKVGMLSYSGLVGDVNNKKVVEGQSLVLDFGLSSFQFGAIYFF